MEDKELNLEELNKMIGLEPLSDEDIDCSSDGEYIKENVRVLSVENVLGEKLDNERFSKGVYDVSYLCGAISALVSVGINPNKAMDYIVDKEATEVGLEYNLKMADIQKATAIETAKYSYSNKADSF